MGDCCDPDGYDKVFSGRFATRMARRYRRRGLSRSARALVDFLAERGIEGATVLEIGGGVGEIQVELLRRGAARAVNLELAAGYEAEAAQLLRSSGLDGPSGASLPRHRAVAGSSRDGRRGGAASCRLLLSRLSTTARSCREQGGTVAGLQPSTAQPGHPSSTLVREPGSSVEGRHLPELCPPTGGDAGRAGGRRHAGHLPVAWARLVCGRPRTLKQGRGVSGRWSGGCWTRDSGEWRRHPRVRRRSRRRGRRAGIR